MPAPRDVRLAPAGRRAASISLLLVSALCMPFIAAGAPYAPSRPRIAPETLLAPRTGPATAPFVLDRPSTPALAQTPKPRPPARPAHARLSAGQYMQALRGYQRNLADWRHATSAHATASLARPLTVPQGPLGGCGEWNELAPFQLPYMALIHSMAYDGLRDRLVSFGGDVGDPVLGGKTDDEIHVLGLASASQWAVIPPASARPPARNACSLIYDPIRDRAIVFGGTDGSGAYLSDLWAFDFATSVWTELTPAGTPPAEQFWHTAVYDPAGDRMIVYGGFSSDAGNPSIGDVWTLTLSGTPTWTLLTPTGTPPPTRGAHAAILDAPRNRMIVFGGESNESGPGSVLNDVWALSLSGGGSWSAIVPSGTLPARRGWTSAIFDAPRNRMVVFGGFVDEDSIQIDRSDSWSLNLSGTPKWTKLNPSGEVPVQIEEHAAVYDPVRQRLLSFGGYNNEDRLSAMTLTGGGSPSWSVIQSGPPQPRSDHAAVYDAVRHRMLVFGGTAWTGNPDNDVWAFALSGTPGWTRLQPTTPCSKACRIELRTPSISRSPTHRLASPLRCLRRSLARLSNQPHRSHREGCRQR